MNRLIILAIVVIAAIYVLISSIFVVNEREQAIVLRFGQYQYAVNADGSERKAGLHFKMPVVENVIYYDKRNMGFDLDSAEIIAADQQRLNVDAIARWRIKDPTQFFRAATSMENGLAQLRQRFTNFFLLIRRTGHHAVVFDGAEAHAMAKPDLVDEIIAGMVAKHPFMKAIVQVKGLIGHIFRAATRRHGHAAAQQGAAGQQRLLNKRTSPHIVDSI